MRRFFLLVIINELLIIGLFIFISGNFIGFCDKTIKSDGIGYYEYLPSILIHHDFLRKNTPVSADSATYDRIGTIVAYLDYNDFKINKYACGTAVLQLPFFLGAYLLTDMDGNFNDGYQPAFHNAILVAAIFYLFLSLIFLRKILELYKVRDYLIIITQLLLVFATGVTNYANYDASFSHIYSLFATTAFIYFVKSYFDRKNISHFLLAAVFLGLILILRQVNILIVLFIPFLSGSISNFRDGVMHILKHPAKLMTGVLLTSVVFSIQGLLWYLQTGNLFLYSYQGEGFNFTEFHFTDILFSFKKGLFIYTPVLFIALVSMIWLFLKRNWFPVISWMSFFIIITYILSSWHSWWYGASYGSRVYIDFYPVFFIPIAIMMESSGKYARITLVTLAVLTIPLNLVQTYQYKKFILHWTDMDKTKYREVFLQTGDRYKGLFWKKGYHYSDFVITKEINAGDILAPAKIETIILNESSKNIPDFDRVVFIQVMFENDFNSKNDSRIIVDICDSTMSHNFFWLGKSLISFNEDGLNLMQTGFYNFELKNIPAGVEKSIVINVRSAGMPNHLINTRIKFFKYK